MPTARHDAPTDRLRANLEALGARIEAACGRGEHAAGAVRLVVVTKSQPAGIFEALAAAGAMDVGESRVQAAAARRPAAPAGLTWHGIGPLQRNKARRAIGLFDVFHALDRLSLARRLEDLLAAEGRIWPVFLQVEASGEGQKHGVGPDEALALHEAVVALPHLEVVGFMTMAAQGAEESALRQTFGTLRALRNEAVRCGRGTVEPAALSMGMSDDFEIAVEEGATHVRVGRAVFEGVHIDAEHTASPRGGGGQATGDHT